MGFDFRPSHEVIGVFFDFDFYLLGGFRGACAPGMRKKAGLTVYSTRYMVGLYAHQPGIVYGGHTSWQ